MSKEIDMSEKVDKVRCSTKALIRVLTDLEATADVLGERSRSLSEALQELHESLSEPERGEGEES